MSAALRCHAPDISRVDDELRQAQPTCKTVSDLLPTTAGRNHLPRDGAFL